MLCNDDADEGGCSAQFKDVKCTIAPEGPPLELLTRSSNVLAPALKLTLRKKGKTDVYMTPGNPHGKATPFRYKEQVSSQDTSPPSVPLFADGTLKVVRKSDKKWSDTFEDPRKRE